MYVAGFPQGKSAPYLLHPAGPGSPSGGGYFQHDYHELVDYAKAENILPNNEYATVPHHPSEAHVANQQYGPTMVEKRVWQDQTIGADGDLAIGDSVIGSLINGKMVDYTATAAQGHHYGKGVCQAINICDAGQLPGSKCVGPNGEKGYCFEAAPEARHKLMCGRMLSVADKYEQSTVALDLTAGYGRLDENSFRCPRGAPATELGSFSVSRLMIGGCMDSDDEFNYQPLAEIHVPQMCSAGFGAGVIKGCMFPGAENFDPDAKQPGNCHYLTKGCTSSTALNYNEDATIDDGTCIEPKPGCTVAPGGYSGVDEDTPGYQERYFGSALRSIGEVVLPAYADMTTYDATANVLSGCQVAIEGCMDPTAVNYEPYATVNTNSWCIPVVEGCMMPAATNAGNAWPGQHNRQGYAHNFDPAATVHKKEMCVIRRVGCMLEFDPESTIPNLNYDQYATVPEFCYKKTSGCLDTAALNLGCKQPGTEPCENGLEDKHMDQITVHAVQTCTFSYSPPPSPPPPKYPPLTVVSKIWYITAIGVKVQGTPTQADLNAVKVKVEDTLACQDCTVDVSVEGSPTSSRRERRQLVETQQIKIVITSTSDTANYAVKAFVDEKATGSVEAIQAFIGDSVIAASVALVTVELEYDIIPAPSMPPPSDDVPIGAIVGGVVGGVVFLVCVAIVVIVMMKKKPAVKPDY